MAGRREAQAAKWSSVAVVASLLAGGFLASPAAVADSLDLLSNGLPTGRAYSSAVWTGTEALVFGGENSGGYFNEIVRVNPDTSAVSIANAALPSARQGTSAAWDGTHAYVFGGFTGATSRDIVRYNPATDTTNVLASRLPSARYDTSAVWTGTHAFIIGGWGNGDLNQIVRFNPANGAVNVMGARLPWGRAATTSVWDGTHVFIFGGTFDAGGGQGYISTDQILRYHPGTDTLTVMDEVLPEGRFLMGGAYADEGSVFLFGGVNHAHGATTEVLRYDPAEDRMDVMESTLSIRREGPSAVWTGDEALVFGGAYFFQGWQYLTEIVRYAPGAPNAPEAVAATGGPGVGDITVTWEAPEFDGGVPVSAYRVYGGASPASLALLTETTARSFTESGFGAGVTRHYAVTALNTKGESPLSDVADGTSFTAPSAPRFVQADAGPSPGKVTVSWVAPLDDGGSAVTSYNVYRGASAGTETLIAAGITSATFEDSGLAPGATVHYVVTALNAVGEGTGSASVAADAPDVPGPVASLTTAPGPALDEITLTWNTPLDEGGLPVTSYRIEAETSPGVFTFVRLTGLRSFTDDGLATAEERTYRVRGVNAVGDGVPTDITGRAPAPPSPPQDVAAEGGPGIREVTVTWSAPVDDGGRPVTSYRLYRGAAFEDAEFVTTVTGAFTYGDRNRPVHEPQRYWITAVNVAGEGEAGGPGCAMAYPSHYAERYVDVCGTLSPLGL